MWLSFAWSGSALSQTSSIIISEIMLDRLVLRTAFIVLAAGVAVRAQAQEPLHHQMDDNAPAPWMAKRTSARRSSIISTRTIS